MAALFVTDGNGGNASQRIRVTVLDVNDAPTAERADALGAPNVPVGYEVDTPLPVARISVTDDSIRDNGITLSGPDAGYFSVVSDGGRVDLVPSPGATAALAGPTTLSVTIDVDDPALGRPVDATTTFSVRSLDPGPEDHEPLLSGVA